MHEYSVFYQVLVKLHQDARRLRPGRRAGMVNLAVLVAVDKSLAVGPAHGGFGPIRYGASVRECGEVTLGGQVVTLVIRVVVQNLSELLAGDAGCGMEGSVPVDGSHSGDSGPINGVAVPALSVHVCVGVAQVLAGDVRLTLQIKSPQS